MAVPSALMSAAMPTWVAFPLPFQSIAWFRGRPPPDAYGADQISQLDVELTSDLVVPKDADSIRVDVVGLDVVGLPR